MKKVLIIAYLFPPLPAIGSQRPYRIAKYLKNYGWEPIILTARHPGKRPDGIKFIETDYDDVINLVKAKLGFNTEKGVHEQVGIQSSKNYSHSAWKSKLIKITRDIIAYPDDQKGWYTHAIKSASEFLSSERVDVIVSTSYPVTAHLIARKLKQEYDIPWIADFRDPWTQNPYVNKHPIVKYFEKRMEFKTLADANMIVAVTDYWANKLRTLHGNKKTICVSNGYDEDDFPALPSNLTKKFTITYTGLLYNGKRDPTILFEVIGKLIKEKKIDKNNLDIRFYGPEEDWLWKEVDKYDLKGAVSLHGSVSREDALQRQRESQLLLLLLWDNEKEEGFCPGKIYEYFGARRPVIAIGGRSNSMIKDLLEITNSGQLADNQDSLNKIILDYYMEFKKFGEIKDRSNNKIKEFTYDSIVRRYSEILSGLV